MSQYIKSFFLLHSCRDQSAASVCVCVCVCVW